MNDFPEYPTDSMGGIALFNFIEVENVTEIAKPINHRIITAVVFKTSSSWLNGYSSINALQYSEPSKQSGDGISYEAELKGFVPDSPEMLQLLVKMEGRRFVLHITDNDGMEKIVGNIEQPLTFYCDFETQTVSGVKGYTYKFKGLLEYRAPIYHLYSGIATT